MCIGRSKPQLEYFQSWLVTWYTLRFWFKFFLFKAFLDEITRPIQGKFYDAYCMYDIVSVDEIRDRVNIVL